MNIECPSCQSQYEVDDSFIGEKVECEECKTSWIVKKEIKKRSPPPKKTEGENIIITVYPHLSAYIGSFIGAIIFSLILIVVWVILSLANPKNLPPEIYLLMSPVLLIITVLFLNPILKIKTTKYEITTQRVISSVGVLSKSKTFVDSKNINYIDVNKRLSQRIFGTGDIILSTSSGAVALIGVKNPENIVSIIKKNLLH